MSKQRSANKVLPAGANRKDSGAGAVLRWNWGARPPRFTCCPSSQIQKLADHSGAISEIPKCSIIQIFRGSARPDLAGGAYSDPPEPLAVGRGHAASLPRTPFLLVSTGLRI